MKFLCAKKFAVLVKDLCLVCRAVKQSLYLGFELMVKNKQPLETGE